MTDTVNEYLEIDFNTNVASLLITIVNPLELDENKEQQEALQTFLKAQSPITDQRTNHWVGGKFYFFPNSEDKENKRLIMFTHSLTERLRKNNKSDDRRFEFSMKKKGGGGFGTVWKTLPVELNKNELITPSKRKQNSKLKTKHVVKFIPQKNEETEERFKQRINTEVAELMHYEKNELFRARRPVFFKKRGSSHLIGAITFKKFSGENAYKFLETINLSGRRKFTTTQKVNFTRRFLEALQKFKMANRVHKDIKLSNVIVKQKGDDFDVNIIDVGTASPPGTNTVQCGTLSYIAPEIIGVLKREVPWCEFNSDIYSAHYILLAIWDYDHYKLYQECVKENKLQNLTKVLQSRDNFNNFTKSYFKHNIANDISEKTQGEIKEHIINMMASNPESRPTVETLITFFSKVQFELPQHLTQPTNNLLNTKVFLEPPFLNNKKEEKETFLLEQCLKKRKRDDDSKENNKKRKQNIQNLSQDFPKKDSIVEKNPQDLSKSQDSSRSSYSQSRSESEFFKHEQSSRNSWQIKSDLEDVLSIPAINSHW